MTNLLAAKKPLITAKKIYLTIGIVAFVIGGFITNRVDNFASDHLFSYQSPITIQSPVIISEKPLVSPIIVMNTIEVASPSAIPTASPKVLRLR